MTNIELPIWLLTVLIATPSICLFALTLRAVKRGRQKRESGIDGPFSHPGYNTFVDSSFQCDLHALQIDAVFNALVALIETERIKLKSLLCPAQSHTPEYAGVEDQHSDPLPDQIEASETEMVHQIIERTAQGESAGDIANDLGISRSEVALAISIYQEVGADQKPRLEAVA